MAEELKDGAEGEAVKRLQAALNEQLKDCKLKVDGLFGRATLAAVKAYQRSRGLESDGIVGSKTQKAIDSKTPAADL